MTHYVAVATRDNKTLVLANTQRKTKGNLYTAMLSKGNEVHELFADCPDYEFIWNAKSGSWDFYNRKAELVGCVKYELNEEKNKAASIAKYNAKRSYIESLEA